MIKKHWNHERIDKTSNETINKAYADQKQFELIKKGENVGKALGKHVISPYLTGISQVAKIKYV